MRVVVALGGNALLRRGEVQSLEAQRRNVRAAGQAIAEVAQDHEVVVTHGNGPQVGLLALRTEASGQEFAAGLDLLGAETEGMIGYLLEQELMNRMPGRDVATVLTQVEVDSVDPAFRRPTKPIGLVYPEDEAMEIAREKGWVMGRDGEGYRRMVASPIPRSICQLRAIKLLVDAGVVVVCAGGGGIPVVRGADGRLAGVDAVIDKDRTSGLVATALEADMLLLLTDVDAVYRDFGGPDAAPIARATPAELEELGLVDGSMGPKVGAAAAFVAGTGRSAAIGALDQAAAIVRGVAGTHVVLGSVPA